MADQDELGLPNYIDAKAPEVGDSPEIPKEIFIDLPTQDAEVDKIRINMRSGVTLRIFELWNSGAFTISIQTPKGQRDIIAIDPTRTGHNAVRLYNPSDIL